MSGQVEHLSALGSPIGDVGCRVFGTGVQAITTATDTEMDANAEDFDTDDMHDNVTENTKIIIKQAGRYVVTATVEWAANNTGTRDLRIINSGTADPRAIDRRHASVSETHTACVAAIVTLAENDELQCRVYQTSGGDLDAHLRQFSVYRVNPNTQASGGVGDHYVSANATLDAQTIPSSSATILEFPNEIADTDGYFDPGVDNTKFTIPAGLGGRYLINCVYEQRAGSGWASLGIARNGSLISPPPTRVTWAVIGSQDNGIGISMIQTLTPGQYLQGRIIQTAGSKKTTHVTAFQLFKIT